MISSPSPSAPSVPAAPSGAADEVQPRRQDGAKPRLSDSPVLHRSIEGRSTGTSLRPRTALISLDELAQRNRDILEEYEAMEPGVRRRLPPVPDAAGTPAPGYAMLRRAPMYTVAYELIPDPYGIKSQSHGFTVIGDLGRGSFSGLHYTGLSGDHTRTTVHLNPDFIDKVAAATAKDQTTGGEIPLFSDQVLAALHALSGRDYPSKELFAPEYVAERRKTDPGLSDKQLKTELKQLAIQAPEAWMQHWPRRPDLGHPAGRGWVTLDAYNIDLIRSATIEDPETGQPKPRFTPEVLGAIDALQGGRFKSRDAFATAYDAQRRTMDAAISDGALARERQSLFGDAKAKGNLAERDTQKMEDLAGPEYYTGKVFDRKPLPATGSGRHASLPGAVQSPVGDHLVPPEHLNSGSVLQMKGGSIRRVLGADPLKALEKNNWYWKLQLITDEPLKRDGRMVEPAHDEEQQTILGVTHDLRMKMVERHPTYKMYPKYAEGEGNCNSGVSLSIRDAGVSPADMAAASPWSFGFRHQINLHDPLALQKKAEESDASKRDPERDTAATVDKSPIRGMPVRTVEIAKVARKGPFTFGKGKIGVAHSIDRKLALDPRLQAELGQARPDGEQRTSWTSSEYATSAVVRAAEQNKHLPRVVRDSHAKHDAATDRRSGGREPEM
jgi:hypothetical protein